MKFRKADLKAVVGDQFINHIVFEGLNFVCLAIHMSDDFIPNLGKCEGHYSRDFCPKFYF